MIVHNSNQNQSPLRQSKTVAATAAPKKKSQLVIGMVSATGAGKTCLRNAWTTRQPFVDRYTMSIGIDFSSRTIAKNDADDDDHHHHRHRHDLKDTQSLMMDDEEELQFQCWEVVGGAEFRIMAHGAVFARCHAIVIPYDVTDCTSLDVGIRLLDEVQNSAIINNKPEINFFFVGTKADLRTQPQQKQRWLNSHPLDGPLLSSSTAAATTVSVDPEEVRQFCQKRGITFLGETSAKTGANVVEALGILTETILSNREEFSAKTQDMKRRREKRRRQKYTFFGFQKEEDGGAG